MSSNVDTDFLLIGKLGQGRSATGNSILRNESFKSSSAMADVTASFDFDYAFLEGRVIKVVDTPGLRDLIGSSSKMKESFDKFLKCAVATNTKGYHVFLIVIRFGTRVTEEELNIVSLLKAEFGEKFAKESCIIAMSFGDLFRQEHEKNHLSFQQWCQKQTGAFKQLLEECGGRIVLFDNKTTCESVRKQQVIELFAMVGQLKGQSICSSSKSQSQQLVPVTNSSWSLLPKSSQGTLSLQDSSGRNSCSGKDDINEAYKEISLALKELKTCQHSLDNEIDRLENVIIKLDALLIHLEKLIASSPQVRSLVKIAVQTKRAISEEIKLQMDLKSMRDEYTLNNSIRKCRYSEENAGVVKRYSSLLAENPNDYDKHWELCMERDEKLRRLCEQYESERRAAEDDFRNVIFEQRKHRMADIKHVISPEKLEEEFRQSRQIYVKAFLSVLVTAVMRPFKYLYSKWSG
ncbi:uncharacterized protein LOC106068842 [Biomphalaria glabrata]|uniref:Uncharacterized protein LOC106068842 n=1 Tax=Biomphalaria glabrata TaxID=6526 RepID=A0A9W2YP68_BIOGL|nr:uncharacterized protein LOC106068842 [Biomphalaria glabrata]